MAVPMPIRNILLRLLSLLVLGTRGVAVHKSLSLHPHGEFISDEIRSSTTHYELINLVKAWHSVRPKSVVDVGANLGNHSNFFALKGAGVVAFEPVEANFNLLRLNLEHGLYHQVALGSSSACGELVFDSSSMGDSHLRGSIVLGNEEGLATEVVQIRTLDSFALDAVDLLKIDVEGYEMEVLRGAKDTLKRARPVIWLELHSDERLRELRAQYTRGDLISWLLENGYESTRELDASNFLFSPSARL